MYQPPHFREDRLEVQHALIHAHSLGLLITAGPGGLQANLIPILVYADASERGTLRAHLAAVKDGPGLVLSDEKGTGRAGLAATKDGTGLALSDKDGKPIWRAP